MHKQLEFVLLGSWMITKQRVTTISRFDED